MGMEAEGVAEADALLGGLGSGMAGEFRLAEPELGGQLGQPEGDLFAGLQPAHPAPQQQWFGGGAEQLEERGSCTRPQYGAAHAF